MSFYSISTADERISRNVEILINGSVITIKLFMHASIEAYAVNPAGDQRLHILCTEPEIYAGGQRRQTNASFLILK